MPFAQLSISLDEKYFFFLANICVIISEYIHVCITIMVAISSFTRMLISAKDYEHHISRGYVHCSNMGKVGEGRALYSSSCTLEKNVGTRYSLAMCLRHF